MLESFVLGNGFTDARDGNHYKVVKIGNQIWMAENLRYLPNVVGDGVSSITTPIYYVYGYDGTDINAAKATSNYTTYGVLYNWPAAMTGCPTGWHLPSDDEWTELINYLGGKSVAGGKLKETGTKHWNSPNTGATNEMGFTALPGGSRRKDISKFFNIGYFGYWWSSTSVEINSSNAWSRTLYYNDATVFGLGYEKSHGFSVRCVKD